MTNFARLLDRRRNVHETQDQQQPERQLRSRYAQHAVAEQQNLSERQSMEQLERDYRQHNVGSPQATLGQMEDWQKQRAQQQGQQGQQQANPHAQRDWDVSMRSAQQRKPDNTGEMKIEKPKQQLPNLNDDKVLAQAAQVQQTQDPNKRRSLSR
jgi:hypothetical protein